MSKISSPVAEENENDTAYININDNDYQCQQRTRSDRTTKQRLSKPKSSTESNPSSSKPQPSIKKKNRTHIRASFKANFILALRVAIGAILAGIIQTREPPFRDSNSNAGYGQKKWIFFPSNYYLGGLSYAAVMVVFCVDRTVGATLCQVWQGAIGVALALVYNWIVFGIFPPTYQNLIFVKQTIVSSNYYISVTDFYTILPFVMLFTLVTLSLPIASNTKKFMVGMNIYFALTILNPMDPNTPTQTKSANNDLYALKNILINLSIYFIVGVVGSFIVVLALMLPYPVFATNQLKKEIEAASEDITISINVLIDSNCFKMKNVKQMEFCNWKFIRQLKIAKQRRKSMILLLNSVWWEQIIGLSYFLHLHKSKAKQFMKLYALLLDDLKAMHDAMKMDSCNVSHGECMDLLQKNMYLVQYKANELIYNIADTVLHNHVQESRSKLQADLHTSIEKLLHQFSRVQIFLLRSKCSSSVTFDHRNVANLMPLHLFMFSFHNFTTTVLQFDEQYKDKNYQTTYRVRKFLYRSVVVFIDKSSYSKNDLLFACKTSVAILIATFISVYGCGYSSTAPSVIAYVAGNHIGGSFGITLNRVAGIVAGSILPSIIMYFICEVCDQIWNNIFRNVLLFVWTLISMYVYFDSTFASYAGVVSAFVAASIALTPCGCDTNSVNIISYSSLTETSIGISIFILIEMFIFPQSANDLLRQSVAQALDDLSNGFTVLFKQHIGMDDDDNGTDTNEYAAMQKTLHITVPNALVQHTLLIQEAKTEPTLWHPVFFESTYYDINSLCYTLLNRMNLLMKSLQWYQTQTSMLQSPTTPTITANNDGTSAGNMNNCTLAVNNGEHHVATTTSSTATGYSNPVHSFSNTSWRSNNNNMETQYLHMTNEYKTYFQRTQRLLCRHDTSPTTWDNHTSEILARINDLFNTLMELFSDRFYYSSENDKAIYIQMKEAFRLADTNCTGEITFEQLLSMLETILMESNVSKNDMIEYANAFMCNINVNHNGKVYLHEFINALDKGLKLEIDIWHNKRVYKHRADDTTVLKPAKTTTLESKTSCVSDATTSTSTMAESTTTATGISSIKNTTSSHTLQQQNSSSTSHQERPSLRKVLRAHSTAFQDLQEGLSVTNGDSDHDDGNGDGAILGNQSASSDSEDDVLTKEAWKQKKNILDIESFKLLQLIEELRSSYMEWIGSTNFNDKTNKQLFQCMQDIFIVNCFFNGIEGVVRDLTNMGEVLAS